MHSESMRELPRLVIRTLKVGEARRTQPVNAQVYSEMRAIN